MRALTPAARLGRWRELVEAKLRDVADWRLWHNNTDTPLLEVDARDARQKWALPGHVPPMHPHWHRPAAMRAEVPSHCWRGTNGTASMELGLQMPGNALHLSDHLVCRLPQIV